MALRVNPFRRESRAAAGAESGLATPSPWLTEALGGGQTGAAERVNPQTAMRMLDVFAAVNIIAELIGGLPLNVYRQVGDVTLEASDHRAYRMLHDRPNPFTPANRFWSTITVHLLLYGNAFVEKLRDDSGVVSELRVVHPTRVGIDWNEAAGVKRYTVTRQTGAQDGPFGDDRILHIFGVSDDGLLGLSPITQARERLGIVRARERFEGDMYASQPFLSGVVKHPGQLKDGGVKLRESWRAIYGSGSRDRHGVAVLEEGAEFDPIRAQLKDMQFVESAQLSKTEIAVLFKLPPSFLGGSVGDSLTYATVEGNAIQLATMAVAPVAHNIATFVSQDFGVFPFSSWFCAFQLDELMRGDSVSRSTYYHNAIADGWLLVEEVRRRENLPPLEEEAQDEAATHAALQADDAQNSDPAASGGAPAPPPMPPGMVPVKAHTRPMPKGTRP